MTALIVVLCMVFLLTDVESFGFGRIASCGVSQLTKSSALSLSSSAIASSSSSSKRSTMRLAAADPVVSPFDTTTETGRALDAYDDDDELPLTRENVELVLDEMRPYLESDGGNVKLTEIDGPIVRLELVGACGTCPSSSMTMKMGLERKLKERIPEIAEVVQSIPDAPKINTESVETVLDGVRPFLAVAGGKISVETITGVGGLQPSITLKMEGSAASLQSVKLEIMQRIQRHFLMAVRVEWV